MPERLAHCTDFPSDGGQHEGTWEILDDDKERGTRIWDEETGCRPVRVVVSRWKTSNIPSSRNWDDFSGGGPPWGTTYFNEQCPHGLNPRRLHQEEMNLSPLYTGLEGEILMHDPVIRNTNEPRVDRLDDMLRTGTDLPIIHVAVNGDDSPSGSRAFDVFIKDRRLNPMLYLKRYGRNLGLFYRLSRTAGTERYDSAVRVNACGACAAEGEVTLTVEGGGVGRQSNDGTNALSSTRNLGWRGFGWPIPLSAVRYLPRTACVIFVLPDGGRLRMPAWDVREILRYRRWQGVKVYPRL